jgi:hypothetical protein
MAKLKNTERREDEPVPLQLPTHGNYLDTRYGCSDCLRLSFAEGGEIEGQAKQSSVGISRVVKLSLQR